MSRPEGAPWGDTEHAEVRRAGRADIAQLVELRAQMLVAMGTDVGADGGRWRSTAADWFARRLDEPASFAAFVAELPGGLLASCAVGACELRAPSPSNLFGVHGHVSNVCTMPGYRHRGYARGCLVELIDWFARDTQALVLDLSATGDGVALYRSLGFGPPRFEPMRLAFER